LAGNTPPLQPINVVLVPLLEDRISVEKGRITIPE
jgi:hypothetical protein